MNWFKRVANKLDPFIGKTVIHFTTHGCMATEHEFDYIGTIIEAERHLTNGQKMYAVKILKDCHGGELRNNNLLRFYESVPSWYLQSLGGDFYIAYD